MLAPITPAPTITIGPGAEPDSIGETDAEGDTKGTGKVRLAEKSEKILSDSDD